MPDLKTRENTAGHNQLDEKRLAAGAQDARQLFPSV
jgi:hypothetical protein